MFEFDGFMLKPCLLQPCVHVAGCYTTLQWCCCCGCCSSSSSSRSSSSSNSSSITTTTTTNHTKPVVSSPPMLFNSEGETTFTPNIVPFSKHRIHCTIGNII